MYLDEILAAQKRGEARGVVSVCSAHPYVLKQALRVFERPLIEATCNQVNQFGGYTGMTPPGFVRYVRGIARENNRPFENIILGGDHLGPSIWQNEPAEPAMKKAQALVRSYVEAGFTKIHLDCSMRLADDPPGALDVEVAAQRTARLAGAADASGNEKLRYVIGTEVPIPGGAMQHEVGVQATKVQDICQTLEATQQAFLSRGLQAAWERVVAVVVQPGVEFGDDFILPYQPDLARELSRFIEGQPLIYEAHSTDYQNRQALKDLVRDHFAILKVGPALTFAFREAVFALAMMEKELFPSNECSNIMSVLEAAMLAHPEHWRKYYRGNEAQQAFKRKYSFSDRARYYWTASSVQRALHTLLEKLSQIPLPTALLSQFVPEIYVTFKAQGERIGPGQILLAKIHAILEDYYQACCCI